MDIKKLLNDAVIAEAEIPISKAISLMGSSGKREIFVTKGGEFIGMVDAKDILKKQTGNPDKMKLGSLTRRVNISSIERSVEELAGMMLSGDFSEMPFLLDNRIKTLSKSALISLLDKNIFEKKKARDIMSTPYFVSSDDNLTSVKKLLLDLNVSKTPVVDDNNKVVGTVDSLNLLNTIIKKQRADGPIAEKTGIENIGVRTFMDKDITVVHEDESLERIAGLLSGKKTSCILVEKNSILTGIITPKDILKLVGKPSGGGFISLSGYKPEDDMEYEHIKEMVKKTLERLGKMVDITYAVMHIEKHSKGAVKSMYTVSTRMGTNMGLFVADDTDWDLSICVKKSVEKILSSVEKEKDKRRTLKRK